MRIKLRGVFLIGTLGLWGIHCSGNHEPAVSLKYQEKVSPCGGFVANDDVIFGLDEAYCDAEVIYWEYQENTQVLRLSDTRVALNCCGKRTFGVSLEEGIYVFSETDALDGNRCRCSCVFDFSISVEGVSPSVIQIKVVRTITDNASQPVETLYQGSIDLLATNGAIVIDDTPIDPAICTQKAP